MRVLAYEGRRLLGLRSTWLILAAVLVADAMVVAVLARQADPGPLPAADAVRLVTAAVPLLPIPSRRWPPGRWARWPPPTRSGTPGWWPRRSGT